MFKPKYNILLDVGSYSISAYAVDPIDGSIRMGIEKNYAGYQDGEWLDDVDTIRGIISSVIDSTLMRIDCKVKEIYVGVPSEFTKVSVNESKQSFPKGKAITDKEIDDLYAMGDKNTDAAYVTINCSPVVFKLDGMKTMRPIGSFCNTISVVASYTLCNKSFFDNIESLLTRYTKAIKFVPTAWAEAISLIDGTERDSGALVCDVGYISTSVVHVHGDGVLDMASLSQGGAYITSDLMTVLKIPFNVALKLKPMIDFSIEYGENDNFTIVCDGKEHVINARLAAEIAIARVEDMARRIKNIIAGFTHKCPPYLKLYLTGGSLAEMRGVINIVKNELGFAVEILSPTLPQYNRPRFASLDGIYYIQRQNKGRVNIKSIFGLI